MLHKSGYPVLWGVLFLTIASFVAKDASAKDMRFDIGVGVHGGDPKVTFNGVSDNLNTDTGFAVSAGIWKDKLFAEKLGQDWLSIGAEYLRLQDSNFSETTNATVLGGTLTGKLDLKPVTDSFFINLAARSNSNKFGKFHPYLGGGVGLANTKVNATFGATLTVGGSTYALAGTSDSSDTSLAGQFFVGADYDLTDKVYVGAKVRYFMTDATLFGANTEFRNLIGMAVLGVKF